MRKRTKVIAIVATSVVLAGTATGAFAYWTATGSGSGSALTASAPVGLTVNQDSVLTVMAPGSAAQTLSGDFTNTDAPVYVTSVTAEVGHVTEAVGAPAGSCDATDFVIDNAVMPVGIEVEKGTNVESWGGAQISFLDKAVDQDACQGATVEIDYTVQ